MADRDLLHKPMPHIAPEGDDNKRAPAPPQLGKLGVAERAREVAREADAQPLKNRARNAPAGPAGKPASGAKAPAEAGEVAPKAFRAAYFNRDTTAMGTINQRTQQMAALRGQEGAADLKRVVLPQPPGAENPSPERLHSALQRMAGTAAPGEATPEVDLAGLLGRQAGWTRKEGVTAEMVAALHAKLERLVALRRGALERMRGLSPAHLEGAPTLGQAMVQSGTGTAEAPDPEAEAEALIDANARRGAGMVLRLSKVMGSKR